MKRRPPTSGVPGISKTALWSAWKAVRKELKNSSVRDVVDYLDYDINPEFWINRLLRQIAAGQYEPFRPDRFRVGKASGLFRTITIPGIPDLVLYRAISDHLYGRMKFREHKHVYFLREQLRKAQAEAESCSTAGDDGYGFTSHRGFRNWLQYSQYRKRLILKKVYPFFVLADIANFFDSLLHSHVEEALRGVRLPSRMIGLLFFLLERLSIRQDYSDSHGISLPVDEFDCSRTMAHLALFSHDDAIVRTVGEEAYVRWMDDQVMGVPSRATGLKLLGQVGETLGKVHLTPNTKKSCVLSLSEVRRHFHLDVNALLDSVEPVAKKVTEGHRPSVTELRREVRSIWRKAKIHEGKGEFAKVLKRIYRLSGLSRSRMLRQRAVDDVMRDPTSAERVCDYVRVSGTPAEYLAFVKEVLGHEEHVYPDVSLNVIQGLLRLEPSTADMRPIRRIAVGLLASGGSLPGGVEAAALCPLLLLRYGDRRSLPLMLRTMEAGGREVPARILRACAVVYASFGDRECATVKRTAAKLLENNLAGIVRLIDEVRHYKVVPDRFKNRLVLNWDSVRGIRYLDIRTILTARLLQLNHSPAVQAWLQSWKKKAIASPVSDFDRRLLNKLVPL